MIKWVHYQLLVWSKETIRSFPSYSTVEAKLLDSQGCIIFTPEGKLGGLPRIRSDLAFKVHQSIMRLDRTHQWILVGFYLIPGDLEKKAKSLDMSVAEMYRRVHKAHNALLIILEK